MTDAIPVSAPMRADSRRIPIALKRTLGSLNRLRNRPEVALLLLGREHRLYGPGRAQVVREPIAGAAECAAVAIDVQSIDDHRQPEFEVDSGGRQALERRRRAARAAHARRGAPRAR